MYGRVLYERVMVEEMHVFLLLVSAVNMFIINVSFSHQLEVEKQIRELDYNLSENETNDLRSYVFDWRTFHNIQFPNTEAYFKCKKNSLLYKNPLAVHFKIYITSYDQAVTCLNTEVLQAKTTK